MRQSTGLTELTELTAGSVRLVHALPGRVRIHVSALGPADASPLEQRLLHIPGVRAVRVYPRTKNLLIHFDPRLLTAQVLLDVVPAFDLVCAACRQPRPQGPARPTPSPVGGVRAVGDAAEMVLAAVRHVAAPGGVPAAACLATALGALALLERVGWLREQLRGLFGRPLADLLFRAAEIVANVLAGRPVGAALVLLQTLCDLAGVRPALSLAA
jgi:hypothetical protein